MECPSPAIKHVRKRRQSDEEFRLGERAMLGFIMDGVTELRAWSENNDFTFKYFEDPNYFEFYTEVYINEEEENLQIKVRNYTLQPESKIVTCCSFKMVTCCNIIVLDIIVTCCNIIVLDIIVLFELQYCQIGLI